MSSQYHNNIKLCIVCPIKSSNHILRFSCFPVDFRNGGGGLAVLVLTGGFKWLSLSLEHLDNKMYHLSFKTYDPTLEVSSEFLHWSWRSKILNVLKFPFWINQKWIFYWYFFYFFFFKVRIQNHVWSSSNKRMITLSICCLNFFCKNSDIILELLDSIISILIR